MFFKNALFLSNLAYLLLQVFFELNNVHCLNSPFVLSEVQILDFLLYVTNVNQWTLQLFL